MKPALLALAATGVGLTIGNFVYQAFGSKNYAVAAERSYFGVVALFEAGLVVCFAYLIGAFE